MDHNPETGEKLRVVPGELRKRHVKVGRLVPIDPDDIPAFLEAFRRRPTTVRCCRSSARLSAWLHPIIVCYGFTRSSTATDASRDCFLTRGCVNSVSAQNYGPYPGGSPVKSINTKPRWPPPISRDAATSMAGQSYSARPQRVLRLLPGTCVDQVTFMENLLEPAELLRRIEIWCEEEIRARRLLRGSWPLLREAVLAGEFSRGSAAELTGYETRQARTVLNTLIDQGYLASEGPRASVRLGFPAKIIDRWFPRLYVAPAG